MIFKKKTKDIPVPFDPNVQKAIIKCSICNGEQVAGFKDINTGKFTEVCLIKKEADLKAFMETYGITDISKEY